MPVSSSSSITRLLARADLLFAIGLFGTVLLLVLPVPPFLIDLFLALNIGMSLLVLLAIVYIKDPPEFSAFPTMLLALTLFGEALDPQAPPEGGDEDDLVDAFTACEADDALDRSTDSDQRQDSDTLIAA